MDTAWKLGTLWPGGKSDYSFLLLSTRKLAARRLTDIVGLTEIRSQSRRHRLKFRIQLLRTVLVSTGRGQVFVNDFMNRCVVISQPMYFPWVGMMEQMRLADVYVHYDDVQFSKGGFTNRVQVKTGQGPRWLTVPLRDLSLGTSIQNALVDDRQNWRKAHRTTLDQAYARTPYRAEMLAVLDEVFGAVVSTIAELSIQSMLALHRYFAFTKPEEFKFSSAMAITGIGSQRVLDTVKAVEGDRYLTGHGARQYLDHELFERSGVTVEYIDYQKRPYPQLHGDFTPFVSTLDLIANCGKEGAGVFVSQAVGWRKFLAKE